MKIEANLLATQWEIFRDLVRSRGFSDEVQLEASRRSFYYGAACCLDIIGMASRPADKDHLVNVIQALRNELAVIHKTPPSDVH